jgi:hypothetical protein
MDYSLHISSCVNVATSEVDDFPSPYCTCCGFPSPLTQVSFICDNKRPGKGAVQLLQRATGGIESSGGFLEWFYSPR